MKTHEKKIINRKIPTLTLISSIPPREAPKEITTNICQEASCSEGNTNHKQDIFSTTQIPNYTRWLIGDKQSSKDELRTEWRHVPNPRSCSVSPATTTPVTSLQMAQTKTQKSFKSLPPHLASPNSQSSRLEYTGLWREAVGDSPVSSTPQMTRPVIYSSSSLFSFSLSSSPSSSTARSTWLS